MYCIMLFCKRSWDNWVAKKSNFVTYCCGVFSVLHFHMYSFFLREVRVHTVVQFDINLHSICSGITVQLFLMKVRCSRL